MEEWRRGREGEGGKREENNVKREAREAREQSKKAAPAGVKLQLTLDDSQCAATLRGGLLCAEYLIRAQCTRAGTGLGRGGENRRSHEIEYGPEVERREREAGDWRLRFLNEI